MSERESMRLTNPVLRFSPGGMLSASQEKGKERTLPRAELLHEAAELITGDRNKSYGEPTANFDNTARIWTAQLGHKLKDGAEFTASDVAQLMIGLKLARLVADPKRDTWLDIAGYAGCGWETVEGEAS